MPAWKRVSKTFTIITLLSITMLSLAACDIFYHKYPSQDELDAATQKDGFSIHFPEIPDVENGSNDGDAYREYYISSDGSDWVREGYYSVTVYDYSDANRYDTLDLDNMGEKAEQLAQQLEDNLGAEIISTDWGKMQDNPDVTILYQKAQTGDSTCYYKIIIANSHLYQISVVSDGDSYSESIVESFKLITE